jgi:hypothetical protein
MLQCGFVRSNLLFDIGLLLPAGFTAARPGPRHRHSGPEYFYRECAPDRPSLSSQTVILAPLVTVSSFSSADPAVSFVRRRPRRPGEPPHGSRSIEPPKSSRLERAAGIEPASPAWKAGVIAFIRRPLEPYGLVSSTTSLPFRRICRPNSNRPRLPPGEWWRGLDLNQRRHSQRIYSPSLLTAQAPLRQVRCHRPRSAALW